MALLCDELRVMMLAEMKCHCNCRLSSFVREIGPFLKIWICISQMPGLLSKADPGESHGCWWSKYKFVSAWLDIRSGKHLYFALYSMTLFDISHAAMFLVFSFPAAVVVSRQLSVTIHGVFISPVTQDYVEVTPKWCIGSDCNEFLTAPKALSKRSHSP